MPTRQFSRLLALLLVVATTSVTFAREPLSVDQGKSGLLLTLRKLRTTARLMHTAAHPDDEDGGMLTLESRGRGAYVVQMTLTRGEGGQNAVGKELGDELGMLRTLELLEADRYYGADQRFSRVADFGYSRSAEETIKKWNGHEIVVGDLVRVIRTLKPDVVISRFIGDSSDGHGNHQASGILTREAFRAAADPTKFPDQIKEGLQPFQAKKLYVRARGDDWNVELDVNEKDPLLGMSYVAWGWQGLKHQLSQGSANWQMPTRMWTSHYKLVDTTIPNYKPQHEKDFFDGIDTTLLALSNIAPNAALLKPGLLELTGLIDEASGLVEKDQKAAAVPLLKGFAKTKELIEQVKKLPISSAEQQELLVQLEAKRDQFRDAANFALGVTLTATAELPAMKEVNDSAGQMWLAVVPGGKFAPSISHTGVNEFTGTIKGPISAVTSSSNVKFVELAKDASYTRQYWHRDDPDRESIYKIDDPQYLTLPLTPWPFVAHGAYEYEGLQGEIVSTVEVATPKPHPLIVGPEWSVSTPGFTLVLPNRKNIAAYVSAQARPNIDPSITAGFGLSLKLPNGWKLIPGGIQQANDSLPKFPGGERSQRIGFQPSSTSEGRYSVMAFGSQTSAYLNPNGADLQRNTYDLGYNVVTRDDLGTAYYFRRATQPVSIVDVKVPQNLRVGYIMGVGDDIPDVLKSIGINVTIVAADSLPTADLTKFDTIVLGIRSYESQPALKANNARLLDFVKNGGTLMAQYAYNTESINGMTPYPLSLSRSNSDRVVDEEAPVKLLVPDSPFFHSPNPITLKDFNGWVQERALYSPTTWDSHYQPLLESKDPDGPAIKGGLLIAPYGKGTYIWNSWAFFRQLPAGVPGAIRLYVNLLAAGINK